jgi:hypothetical protein
MSVVYASIGNSDDHLGQNEWSEYLRMFAVLMRQSSSQVYGEWFSDPRAPWQNACMAIETQDPDTLRKALTGLRKAYKQDSVAWVVADRTEFI